MTDGPPTALWGIDAPLLPLRGGNRNAAFRTQGLTADVVFKSTRRSEMALRWLDAVFDHAEAAGLAVPRLRKSISGKLCEQGWTMEPLLPGRPAHREELSRLAAPIHRLHQLTADLPQRPDFVGATELAAGDGPREGGDIDLDAMPPSLAAACRAAWRVLDDERQAVVHGDLNPSNLLIDADGKPALVDWDEARRDAVTFDLASLGPEGGSESVRHALTAWEIASSWQTEPDYARRLASRFMNGPER